MFINIHVYKNKNVLLIYMYTRARMFVNIHVYKSKNVY